MPTPVSSVRQCLAGEAAAALDEAVSIARRRSHAQTTSLHVVSALLSLPSSSSSLLRDALSRTHSAAHSPRFQFKALELCFSLALDRLPSAGGGGKNSPHQGPLEPPVSNSLMAAIKRSQATQRRNPDTFHLYQHYQQHQEHSSSSSSSAGVKVELQLLVLSMLDDPIVSRVFADAGFRSYDIKFAVLHPPPSILRLPRATRCPPLFLCNFSIDVDLASSPRLYADVEGENCRRIGEVLARKANRNPLLIGVGAAEAALHFERAVKTQNWVVFPPEARGVKFFSVEKDLLEFVRGSRDRPWLESRFRELGLRAAEDACGSSPGIILSFGDLKLLVDLVGEDVGPERVSHAASLLTRLADDLGEKLWLIGSAATYETYMKFLSQCPSVDKDWDLQLLPISSCKLGSGGLFPRTNSSVESFVPLGGFFSPPSNSLSPRRSQCGAVPCHLCSGNYEQELVSLLDQFSAKHPAISPHQSMQSEASRMNGSVGPDKARDDGATLNAKIVELRRKWNDFCLSQHRRDLPVASDHPGLDSGGLPGSIGQAKGDYDRLQRKISQEGSLCPHDELISPLSVSSVSTDLMLGSSSKRDNSPSKVAESKVDDSAFWVRSDATILVSHHPVKSTAAAGGSSSVCQAKNDGDFKGLFRSLAEKVGRQEEAIMSICRTLARCRNGHERLRGSTPRGDVWFSFIGPDKFGKRKVAGALAEVLFGSGERLVCVDLGSESGLAHPNTVCGKHEIVRFDFNRRGKTLVDHIADEIRRRPWSVVLVESLHKADVLVQSSLSRAIKSGKFHDSRGREVDINNVVFVTTEGDLKGEAASPSTIFSEEKILAAEARQMKIQIDTARDSPRSQTDRSRRSRAYVSKRKLNALAFGEQPGESDVSAKRASSTPGAFLDLNLPVEEMASVHTVSPNGGCVSDNTETWMEEFLEAVDETVVFRAFDFDALADEALQEIEKRICAAMGFTFALEIEPRIMAQILAAAWISESGFLKNWLQQVLVRSFIEAQRTYRLSASSVVRLVAREDGGIDNEDDHGPETPLPSSILPCELICHSFL